MTPGVHHFIDMPGTFDGRYVTDEGLGDVGVEGGVVTTPDQEELAIREAAGRHQPVQCSNPPGKCSAIGGACRVNGRIGGHGGENARDDADRIESLIMSGSKQGDLSAHREASYADRTVAGLSPAQEVVGDPPDVLGSPEHHVEEVQHGKRVTRIGRR